MKNPDGNWKLATSLVGQTAWIKGDLLVLHSIVWGRSPGSSCGTHHVSVGSRAYKPADAEMDAVRAALGLEDAVEDNGLSLLGATRHLWKAEA